MKSRLLAAAAAVAVLMVRPALAENQLPTTVITSSKPKPKPPTDSQVSSRGPAATNPSIPDHPDPETPNVRARDWNAPGVLNLYYMTDAQFEAFKATHPTAAFYGRCFAGQDPDPNIRAFLLRRVPFGCKG